MTYNRWTQEQINILFDNYSTMPMEELELLVGKSKNVIYEKACSLKLKRRIFSQLKHATWTQDMLDYIKDNIQSKTFEQIAQELGVTRHAVKAKARFMKIRRDVVGRPKGAKGKPKAPKTKERLHPLFYNQLFGAVVGNTVLKRK